MLYFLSEFSITISDLIAIAALLVVSLSALYTRDARDVARKANEITAHNNLRPSRLEVYQLMRKFARYCCRYPTIWHNHPVPVQGTQDLMEQIDRFKWEIELLGPLTMPTVESKIKEFQNNAWKIQRQLDRLAAGRDDPVDRNYPTGKDNLDAIVDWFANQEKELRATFQTYLSEA